MKKLIRQFLLILALMLLVTPVLSGCAKASKEVSESSDDDSDEDESSSKKKKKKKDKDKDKDKEKKQADSKVDLSTDESIRAYLAGEWTLIDRNTGDEAAVLTIEKDGCFEFERLRNGDKGSGTLSFEYMVAGEGDAPDFYRIEFDDIEELLPEDYELYDGEPTYSSGLYHIGSGVDADYFYMEEIGNGDTIVSDYALNVNEDLKDYEQWTNSWFFVRKNNGRDENAPKTDETFYAWIWERTASEVFLQEMDPNEYRAYGEYNDRAYTAGYFTEQEDIAVNRYALSDNVDLTDLSYFSGWDEDHPLGMYEVSVDSEGVVTSLRDVRIEMYGIYDMGYAEPEISIDGMTFKYNNSEFDVRDAAVGANAIMDYQIVGDWVILDCHVNPDYGLYVFFNMYYADFVYVIQGANLTWQGDDLSTAVYSLYNDVYDFWGNEIGWVEEGILSDLRYKDDHTIEAEFSFLDGNDKERTDTQEFEYEPEDQAFFAYLEYMMGDNAGFDRLMALAPDNAVAYVMVNPPYILDQFSYLAPDEEAEGLDILGVVSLFDHQTIHIESKDPDGEGNNEGYLQGFDDMRRTESEFIKITVPEGMPTETLVVYSEDNSDARWDIWTISGKKVQIGTFVTADW
ncbi:MAG: hypothetical protein K5888_07990 [Lachnospiraceae bacterium]|nr:hypothetical protein [Lachnospiraceae bacterium]